MNTNIRFRKILSEYISAYSPDGSAMLISVVCKKAAPVRYIMKSIVRISMTAAPSFSMRGVYLSSLACFTSGLPLLFVDL